MKILHANKDDCYDILDLQKLSYRQEAEIYDDYQIPPLTQTIDEIREEIKNNTFLKAVIEDVIVGSIRAYLQNDICHIGRLIVHPNYQNKGIGTILMKKIEAHFNDLGINSFQLFTGEESKKNIYLYQKLGYQIYKTEKLSSKVNLVYLKK